MKTKQLKSKNQQSTNVNQQSTDSGLRSRSEKSLSTKTEQKPAEATPTTSTQEPWKGVFFDGPEPDQDREGEEIPVWSVFVGDADANPLSRVYRVHSFARAESLAKAMAQDRQLELVAEAQAA